MDKRRYVQLLSALLYNLNLTGFANGRIYQGNIKGICVPGLNCYSCPGAVAACPLGSLQAALGGVQYKLPFYIAGVLLLFGVLFGRGVCAFLCPFGLIQELLYKIPSPKLRKNRFTRMASVGKYIVLIVFVLVMPLLFLLDENGVSVPAFCKYICPAGTLEGALPLVAANENLRSLLGFLFEWKVFLLLTIILASIFIFRAFCRFLCPLGAIYSLFNKYAFWGIKINERNCVGCNACVISCKLDTHRINDRECVRCGECSSVCGHRAIYYNRLKREFILRRKSDEKGN